MWERVGERGYACCVMCKRVVLEHRTGIVRAPLKERGGLKPNATPES